jgi:hypothetical protein
MYRLTYFRMQQEINEYFLPCDLIALLDLFLITSELGLNPRIEDTRL